MKNQFLLSTCFVLFTTSLSAQERVSTKVAAGDDLNEALATSRYLFADFQDARVIVSNGTYQVKMNYNALTDEMDFFDDSGTLVTLPKNNVRAIYFGERLFRYSPNGYVELLSGRNLDFDLLIHRKFNMVSSKKQGAYGTTSETTSISSFSQISTESGIKQLSVVEDVTYQKTNIYYLYDGSRYYVANKSGFKKVFGKQKPDLDNWLKNNPVNYTKEKDIIRLFTYCIE